MAVAEKSVEMKIRKIRIDKASGNLSIQDTMRALNYLSYRGTTEEGKKTDNAWNCLQQKFRGLREGATVMRLNGKGGHTVTAPPLLLCEIAYLAMTRHPDNRRKPLLKLMEFVSVDVAWIPKWENKYSGSGNSSNSTDDHAHEVVVDVDACEEEAGEKQDDAVEIVEIDNVPLRTNNDSRVGCVVDSEKEKRSRPASSFQPDPPTKRAMTMQVEASTTLCTTASVNALPGSPAPISTSMEITLAPVDSNKSKDRSVSLCSGGGQAVDAIGIDASRSSKGKERDTVGSSMSVDNVSDSSNIWSQTAAVCSDRRADSNNGGGSSRSGVRGNDIAIHNQGASLGVGGVSTVLNTNPDSRANPVSEGGTTGADRAGAGNSNLSTSAEMQVLNTPGGSHSGSQEVASASEHVSGNANTGRGAGSSNMNVVQHTETGGGSSSSVVSAGGNTGADRAGANGAGADRAGVSNLSASAEMQARIDAVQASAVLLPSIMTQLEEVAKSGMSDHAKLRIEQFLIAKLTQENRL